MTNGKAVSDAVTKMILFYDGGVHDIACPLCRKKYGNTSGRHQEEEGSPLAREFFSGFDIPSEELDHVCFLVGHHHTYTKVDGLDYQILLEADFLVNASESRYSCRQIGSFREKVFRTESGLRLLDSIYRLQQSEVRG
jgi:uncharacterized protein